MGFDEVIEMCTEWAIEDVAAHGATRGHLVAARGGVLVAQVSLRPFDRGGAGEAVQEAVLLCAWLRVDQLGLVISGRAHHLEDEAQSPGKILMVERAEHTVDGIERRSVCWPLLCSDGRCARGPELGLGVPEGPVGELLAIALTPSAQEQLPTDPALGREHAVVLLERGHELALSPEAAHAMGLDDVALRSSERAGPRTRRGPAGGRCGVRPAGGR